MTSKQAEVVIGLLKEILDHMARMDERGKPPPTQPPTQPPSEGYKTLVVPG